MTFLGAIVACTAGATFSQSITDPRLNVGPKAKATGEHVMVATQLPIVTETALEVLRQGGNAVDAMVTAVFLQHVVDYHQVSHFGAMSAIYYEASTGRYYALSAVSERPKSAAGETTRVAIAGVVRGLEALSQRFGTRPWASYFGPAIAAAEEGVLMTSFMYGVNFSKFEAGDLSANDDAVREFFMPDGHLVPVGQRWKMPALAEHLKKVASEGADYVYTGPWAEKFVAAVTARGGKISREDMAAYRPRWEEPTRFTYRGHEIIGSPPPDTGGLEVSANLNVLANLDLPGRGHYAQSAETLELMVRTLARVSQEIRSGLRDPLNYHVPSDLWLSKEYGRFTAQYVLATRPKVSLAPSQAPETPAPAGELGSNHNVIVDAEGNWISLLHTGHGGAPGVLIDGVDATEGSSALAESVGPGRRIILPITSILLAKKGRPWLAMGTPGNPPQPVTQVLVNLLDFGMDPEAAVEAPRFWATANPYPEVRIESRIDPEVRRGIKDRGIKLTDIGPYNWHTGSMQIVWRDAGTGTIHGVTDSRRLGCVKGY
jgi:gamma-glutamyltranspeptidase/glutathione hydrolase